MRRKNKKADVVFSAFMVLVTLVVFSSLLFVLIQKYNKLSSHEIGEKQTALFKTYARGERALAYVDQSARLAASQAEFDLAQTGGFAEQSPCRQYAGYQLWDAEKNCLPDEKAEFKKAYAEDLDLFLGRYAEVNIPLDNYQFVLDGNTIIGNAGEKMEIPITDVDASFAAGKFAWPLPDDQRRISSCFGQRSDGFHDAIDIAAPKGTPIYAAAEGVVVRAGGGDFNTVIIDHRNGYLTKYVHASSVLVAKDQTVKKRDKIALVGDTGSAGSFHLHFVILKNNVPVDPLLEYDLDQIKPDFTNIYPFRYNCIYYADVSDYSSYIDRIREANPGVSIG